MTEPKTRQAILLPEHWTSEWAKEFCEEMEDQHKTEGAEVLELTEDTIESVYDEEQYLPHDIPDFDRGYVYRRMVTRWVKTQQRTDEDA